MMSGEVEVRDRCLYIGRHLLIWPERYYLSTDDGETFVVGDGWAIRPGTVVELGGGEYDTLAALPSPLLGSPPPCPGPYVWIGEVLDAR